MQHSDGSNSPSEEKMAYPEYKGHEEQLETVGSLTMMEGDGVLVRPARVFTADEERRLYTKVDKRILPILAFLYLLSFMDRGNVGNARLFGLEKDLGMAGGDYNLALSAYFFTYCFFEVPANLMLKKLRPAIWLPSIAVAWGLVMTLMGFVQSDGGLIACRLALGIAEAGLFPGVVYYLSTWYPRHLVQFRIAVFFSAATMAGAFSGLLAYGIGFMGGIGGYSAWRWIFILEGLVTILVGVIAFFAIVDDAKTSKFLTDEEKAWLIWRKQTDSSSVGEAEGISMKHIISAFKDWQIYLGVLYYSCMSVGSYSIGLFLPTIIKSFGTYTVPQIQLLTVPVYVSACIWVITSAYLSDRLQKRYLFIAIDIALCLVGFVINIAPSPMGLKFFGLFLCAAGSYAGIPSVVTWLGNNLSGQTKRGVGMAFQIGIGNLGGIVASNVYRSVDSPHYYPGHGTVIGFMIMGFFAATTYAWLLTRENAKKVAEQDRQDALPENEKRVYTVAELRDLGDKGPEFVYTI